MRKNLKLHPCVEGLEPLTLLSGILSAATAETQRLSASSKPVNVKLVGTVKGTYENKGPVIADEGLSFTFNGQGTVKPLGNVGLGGTLREVGFIAGSRAGGSLTLTNSQGSVTLTLTGPKQNGPASLPGHFSFKITSATGVYVRDVGHGTTILTLKPVPAGLGTGTFQLVFKA